MNKKVFELLLFTWQPQEVAKIHAQAARSVGRVVRVIRLVRIVKLYKVREVNQH